MFGIEETIKKEELTNLIRSKEKEIIQLTEMNKYLMQTIEQKDRMISFYIEENRKLQNQVKSNEGIKVERAIELEKRREQRESASANIIHEISEFKSSAKKSLPTKVSKSKTIYREQGFDTPKFRSNNLKFSMIADSKSNYVSNPEKMSHFIILSSDLNKQEVFKFYCDIEYIQFTHSFCSDKEMFTRFILNINQSQINLLFDNYYKLFLEHKNMFFLLARIKELANSSIQMMSSLMLTDTMENIVEKVCACLDCDRASVFIVDDVKDELWSKAAKGSKETIRVPMTQGIIGQVAKKGKIINILNAYEDERFNKEIDLKTKYKTNTILTSPVYDQNLNLVAVIQAINKKEGVFGKEDEYMIKTICSIAGGILTNSIDMDDQVSFFNSLRKILKSGIVLSSLNSIPELIVTARSHLKSLFDIDCASVYILKNNFIVTYDDNRQEVINEKIGLIGECVDKQEKISVSNSYNHPNFNSKVDLDTAAPVICFPIIRGDIEEKEKKILGAISIVNKKGIKGINTKKSAKVATYIYDLLEFFCIHLSQVFIKEF